MRSEPVLVAGGIAGGIILLIVSFLAMMVSLEVWQLTPAQIVTIRDFAAALVGLTALIVALPVVTAWFANRKVQKTIKETMTPLADPRAPDGEELTRGDGSPALKARE